MQKDKKHWRIVEVTLEQHQIRGHMAVFRLCGCWGKYACGEGYVNARIFSSPVVLIVPLFHESIGSSPSRLPSLNQIT